MSIVLLIFVIILIYYKLKRRLKLTPPPPPPHLVPVHGSVDSLVRLCAIFSTITLFSNDLSKRPCFKKKHKLCMSRWVVCKKAIEEGGMFLIGIGENRDLWPRWRLRVRDFLNTKQCLCVTSVILVGKSNSHRHSRAIANGAGGGARGAAAPPLDLLRQTNWVCRWIFFFCWLSHFGYSDCNCLPLSYSRSIFRRHISWQVMKITFRSLQI